MKRLPHPTPDPAGPGQESVWAYPRPAIAERTPAHIRIEFDGLTIADTHAAVRVLETSHPPAYYIPPADFDEARLTPHPKRSICEWKGQAQYFTLTGPNRAAEAAVWRYRGPVPSFAMLDGFYAVYPRAMDGCFVDGERAEPQAGPFYGGWITSAVVGPFKGPPGTEWW